MMYAGGEGGSARNTILNYLLDARKALRPWYMTPEIVAPH
jgi:hypothetical protein